MDLPVIFQTMVKLLLMLLLGYILNKVDILDQNTNKKLSKLIVNVTTPLLVLSSVCASGSENRLSVLPVLGGAFLFPSRRVPVFRFSSRPY